VARNSSKRTGGTGGKKDVKDTPKDDSVEDAVEITPTDETTPEAGTVEGSASEVSDTPGTSLGTEGSDTTSKDDTTSADGESEAPTSEDTAHEDDAVTDGDKADAASDGDAAEPDEADGQTQETSEEGAAETVEDTTPADETTTPAPPPERIVEKRGPGFVPLVIGGVVAAGIGYFASFSGLLPGAGGSDTNTEIESALAQQSEVLSALQEQVATLGTTEAPSVDLSPLTDEIAALGARIDETAGAIGALSERVGTLEERPVFTGDVTADAAEAAEAVAAMEEQMRAQEEEAARLAAEAEETARAAEEAIAAAEAEARAAMAAAEAEAALNELRLAVAEGLPFAEPLAAVAAVADVPEALSAAAESGVASLEDVQAAFPAAARAALPVALRESAGDSAVDRFTAFVQGQVGGRAVAPREGDNPDAVLSRAQAAVSDGDLETALSEISALPEGALGEMAGWIADAEARTAVVTALESVAAAVTGAN
jgi:hypothetical protein